MSKGAPVKTLIAVLDKARCSSDLSIHFIDGKGERSLSIDDLYQEALCKLGELQKRGIAPDDNLILFLADNQAFLIMFWACILGRIRAIPVAVGNRSTYTRRLLHIWKALKRPFLITGTKLKMIITSLDDHGVSLSSKTWFFEELSIGDRIGKRAQVQENNIAYIQYSSGSTDFPKGVILTHKNLVNNIIDIAARSKMNRRDKILSWLPLTHDMGLTCYHLTGVYAQAEQYTMSTTLFVRRPHLWMTKASQHQITQLYTPNFGLRFLLSNLDQNKNYDWDLSNVRLIYNGAEPISYELCNKFLKELSKYLLSSHCLYPGYGLAEASVAVTLPKPGDPIKAYWLDRNFLNRGNRIKEISTGNGASFVELGFPIPSCEVRIVDSSGALLEESQIGEVCICGKNVTSGYYMNQELTNQLFIAENWLKTGDLGFMKNGRLVITGRLKNIIIINGQNYYPQDIERIALGKEDSDLEKIAACGVLDESSFTTSLLIFLITKKNIEEFIPIVQQVKKRIQESLGLIVDYVIPIKQLPRTTSGKVQYFKLAKEFKSNKFDSICQLIGKRLQNVDDSLSFNMHDLDIIWKKLFKTYLTEKDKGTDFTSMGINSLQGMQIISSINDRCQTDFTIKEIFDYPNFRSLAARIDQKTCEQKPVIVPVGKSNGSLPPVERLYAIQTINREMVAYNLSCANKIFGNLDRKALKEAFRILMGRYEMLRTSFYEHLGHILGKLHSSLDVPMETVDIHQLNVSLDQIIADFLKIPFDLSKAPLFRIKLISITPVQHVVIFTIHHIICDGWSFVLLSKELAKLYNQLKIGYDRPLHFKSLSYADCVLKILRNNNDPRIKSSKEYWEKILCKPLTKLHFPTKKFRAPYPTFNGNQVKCEIPKSLTSGMQKLAREHQTTYFMVLVAFLQILFYKRTGSVDIIMGTVTTGRNKREFEDQFGYFLRTIILRTFLKPYDHFLKHLGEVKKTISEALFHQEYSYEWLLKEWGAPYNSGHNPLFDVLVIFHNFDHPLDFRNLSRDIHIEPLELPVTSSIVDLEVIFYQFQDQLEMRCRYNTDLYDQGFPKSLLEQFQKLVSVILNGPEISLQEVHVFSQKERNRLARALGGTSVIYPQNRNILSMLQKQVKIRPDCVAVNFLARSLTYSEFNKCCNRLALYLKNRIGIKSGSRVGLVLKRNECIPITLYAILKCGALFIPLEFENSPQRIRQIIQDSNLDALVVNDGITGPFLSLKIPLVSWPSDVYDSLEDELENPSHFSRDAYIIYTSGSTGRPKGVVISYASLNDYACTFSDYFKISAEDKVIQQSSVGFDTLMEEVFPVLMQGGQLVISENAGKDVRGLIGLLERTGITILSTTPLVIHEINKYHKIFPYLQKIISGGDVLKPQYIDQLIHHYAMFNTYGPSESTVCATFHPIQSVEESDIIGTPIANKNVYLLDQDHNPVPQGAEGQICLAGTGLARGYANEPELTAMRFIKNPYAPSGFLYLTGDLGVWNNHGQLRFLGRMDDQVKIKGYRVEVREVENVLLTHPRVTEALVTSYEQPLGEKKLIAYIVTNGELDEYELRDFFFNRLPYYMIPRKLHHVTVIPRNLSGKVDWNILEKTANPLPRKEQFTPSEVQNTELELLNIWKKLLKREEINVRDNFFEIGGDSFKLMRLHTELNITYKIQLEVYNLFSNPTIQKLAVIVEKRMNKRKTKRTINKIEL